MRTQELALIANDIRKDIVKMIGEAGTGHPGGSLGLADIFTVLYFDYLKHNPKKPQDKNRDFVFLSNGHVCPVLYATLAHNGYFPKKELMSLRKIGSRLQGHPHVGLLPGIENSGGPLGQGISQAVGLAASLKRDEKKNKVFCFVGDGEIEEGECWEAFLFATKENLSNLRVIIDMNNIQIDGPTDNVLKLDLLHAKMTAFGFAAIDIDGNNIVHIKSALEYAEKLDKPVAIIAKTVPGKGVSFMENDYRWHGKAPNPEEVKKALAELGLQEDRIKGGKI